MGATKSMKNIPRARRRWNAVWAAGLFLLVAGCGGVSTQTESEKKTELLWPEPPLKPRIKFVRHIRDQNDLQETGGEKLLQVLLGEKRTTDGLTQPMDIAPTPDGKRLYVSDYVKRGVFLFNLEAGTMERFGIGREATAFKRPLGIALDSRNYVYVVDSILRQVRIFNADGKFLRNISHKSMTRPTGIAIDETRQRIYIADSSQRTSSKHVIHIFNMEGAHLKTFGRRGVKNGEFLFPTYVAVGKNGNIYVADTLNARVQVFNPEGLHLKTIGERGDAIGMFFRPKGVALDTFGNVYVVDSGWSNVQIFNEKGQVLLFFGARGRFPGLLFNPTGIAIDKNNRIYIADTFNKRINVYQLINTTEKDSFLTPLPQKEAAKKKEGPKQK